MFAPEEEGLFCRRAACGSTRLLVCGGSPWRASPGDDRRLLRLWPSISSCRMPGSHCGLGRAQYPAALAFPVVKRLSERGATILIAYDILPARRSAVPHRRHRQSVRDPLSRAGHHCGDLACVASGAWAAWPRADLRDPADAVELAAPWIGGQDLQLPPIYIAGTLGRAYRRRGLHDHLCQSRR